MTSTSAPWNPRQAWCQFRLEAEAAKHYPQSYALYIAQTHRDILLERLLPTLLHVKGVAIMDDSLDVWLSSNGHSLTKPYRDDLNGRLEYMKDHSLLADVDTLHQIRKRRNDFAHESGIYCDWAILERDVNSIENALLSLSLVRPTASLAYFAERSAVEGSNEPGVSFSRTFRYGVKEAGNPGLEISWVQKFMHDEAE